MQNEVLVKSHYMVYRSATNQRGAVPRRRAVSRVVYVRPPLPPPEAPPHQPKYGGRIGGLSKSYKCRLRYSDFISLDPSAVSPIASYIFRANSLYDPDLTGVGHQPYGFDQLMARYDHFTVIGSKIYVRNMQEGTSNVNPCVFGIHLSDNNTVPFSDVNHFLESPDGSANSVGGILSSGAYIQAGVGNTISKGFSMNRFFHKKLGDSDMQGSASANPTEGAYFQVLACSINGNDPGSCTFKVTIDFDVIFTEPKILAQS